MRTTSLIKALIKGLPGIEYIRNPYKYSGGATSSANYCYGVWLRHLVMAYENGVTTVPKKVAELGPGDSLGVGISALISGADQYFAFDVVQYHPTRVNLKIFDELVELFKNKTPIPDEREFPKLKPALAHYTFPTNIFSSSYLREILNEDRLLQVRKSVEALNNKNAGTHMINYTAPWNSKSLITNSALDMIVSQAVIQHIDNVEEAFEIMAKWLKPKGLMSHCIDLTSVGSSENLQGHWEYTDFEWKIIRGRLKYLLNREPYSKYIELCRRHNFRIISEIKTHPETAIEANRLAKRFKNLSFEDRNITSLFIQAIKE